MSAQSRVFLDLFKREAVDRVVNSGLTPVAVGSGGGGGPVAAGERSAADGAGLPRKAALIFGAASR